MSIKIKALLTITYLPETIQIQPMLGLVSEDIPEGSNIPKNIVFEKYVIESLVDEALNPINNIFHDTLKRNNLKTTLSIVNHIRFASVTRENQIVTCLLELIK